MPKPLEINEFGPFRERVKPYADLILKEIKKTGHLISGMNKQEFRILYNSLVNNKRDYYFVFFYLLKKNFILPKNKNSPDFIKFNIQRVENYLENNCSKNEGNKNVQSSNPLIKDKKEKTSSYTTLPTIINQRMAFQLTDVRPVTHNVAPNSNYCTTCNKQFQSSELLKDHKTEDLHIALQLFHANPKGFGKGPENDFKGIIIQSSDGKEGRKPLAVNISLDKQNEIKFDLSLSTDMNHTLYLRRVFLVFGDPNSCKWQAIAEETYLSKGHPFLCPIVLKGGHVGRSEFMLAFKFIVADTPDEKIFVMKQISLRVDNPSTVEQGAPIFSTPAVYILPDQSASFDVPQVLIEDIEPPIKSSRQLVYVEKLDDYLFPHLLKSFINHGFKKNDKLTPENLNLKIKYLQTLLSGLTEDNYKEFLSLMLYLEEHQTLYDLRSYSMIDAPVSRSKDNPRFFTIDVPGLAENRPSVLKGDEIFITAPNVGSYRGWVQKVDNTRVHMRLGQKFSSSFIDKMRVRVDFSFNRYGFKVEHRSLDLVKRNNILKPICFPEVFGLHEKRRHKIDFISAQIGNNPEQAQAVKNILNGTSLPAPYIIFGPPGTGKTVTIVEAIKQIFFNSETDCVLATAPSNSAADLIAERVLKSIPASKVLRIYSRSRDWSTVPEILKKSCNFMDGEVIFPCLKMLLKYRVIICTLICSGRLVSAGFPSGHFTHIFIDECGHGMEPTSLVPVAGLLKNGPNPGQLVLSGDPCQLGPVIRSPVAKSLAVSESLLARLMALDIYQKNSNGKYNPLVLTKLVRNFRSHPDILKVPNERFYGGELQACADEYVTYSACNWEELPRKGVPLIFHGVQGKDEKEQASPSYFNIAEVEVTVKYVEKILGAKFQGQKLKPADIGIISPYRRQIMKLHRALERKKIVGISVGSVEEFQGTERRVIIISTVRSDPMKLALDNKFRLGFVKEPKRFNVAITRAKSLLIVIGNPKTLELDPNWRALLKLIIERGGYTGCPFTLSSESIYQNFIDPDDLRVPVKEKLETQLGLAKLFKNTGSLDDSLSFALAGLDLHEGLSEIAAMVNPPMLKHED